MTGYKDTSWKLWVSFGPQRPNYRKISQCFGWLHLGLLQRSPENWLIRYSQNRWQSQTESTDVYVQIKTDVEYLSSIKENQCLVKSRKKKNKNTTKYIKRNRNSTVNPYYNMLYEGEKHRSNVQICHQEVTIAFISLGRLQTREWGAKFCLSNEFGGHCTGTLQSRLSPLSLECYV